MAIDTQGMDAPGMPASPMGGQASPVDPMALLAALKKGRKRGGKKRGRGKKK